MKNASFVKKEINEYSFLFCLWVMFKYFLFFGLILIILICGCSEESSVSVIYPNKEFIVDTVFIGHDTVDYCSYDNICTTFVRCWSLKTINGVETDTILQYEPILFWVIE